MIARNRQWRVIAGATVVLWVTIFVVADTWTCGRGSAVAASLAADRPEGSGRQYARDRKVDILHVALDVTPDFRQRAVEGVATWKFKPIGQPLDELRLDAVRLTLQEVQCSAAVLPYTLTDRELVLTFQPPVPVDQEVDVRIRYRAQPEEGLYFRTPELGYRAEDTHLFTQGEAIYARQWFPCYDEPNEKFTSEITCRVPAGMTVLSNGRKMSEQTDAATGLVAVRWLQDKPHVNYLLTLVAGYFKKLEDQHRDIPLGFFTPPSEFAEAARSFDGTRDMMAFFEREIGVPYPWAKYDQVVVQDFVAGGMENTTQTTLTHFTLFAESWENLQTSQDLVAHELVHQWFGNLVTCKDWSHLWLNEGFATYYASLYEGHRHGRDSMLYELYGRARHLTSLANETNAIVRRTYPTPDAMFDHLAYPKGGWVLHMMRSQLGEELYRRCIRSYLERHSFGSVVTEDLRAVVEELSGRSWDQFFDQWLYHARHPELDIQYAWDERARLARLSIKQVQALSPQVLLFDFPLRLRFKGAFGTVDREVRVSRAAEDFHVALPAAPISVRVDPDYTLLAKVNFELPAAMVETQLAGDQDMIGRLLAVEQLAQRKDQEAVRLLRRALQEDAFYGVRIEAAKALRAIHSDEALDTLLASQNQPDARVRREVLAAVTQFHGVKSRDVCLRALQQEKNALIQAEALRGLSGYPGDDIRSSFTRFLSERSYRNVLAEAAVDAFRRHGDPVAVAAIMEALRAREQEFTARGFIEALEAIGHLARHESDRAKPREFLAGYVNHAKHQFAAAALRGLGNLGDARAIPLMERFAAGRKGSPEQMAAEEWLPKLRAGQPPSVDNELLRKEVLDLQQKHRDLQSQLEDFRKRFEALAEAESKEPAATKKTRPKR